MGKAAGAKVQVTEYYMSQHFGVCTTVDAFKKIIIKEKLAWRGRVTTNSSILIQEDNLFGGATKEGGATGTIYFLPGRGDQVLPDILAQRLGRANGADAPGYRGLSSVFFTGRPDVNKGAKGFYWTANNPYLPGVWIQVERAPVGLTPAFAMIPRPSTATYPYKQVAESSVSYTAGSSVSTSGSMMIRYGASSGSPIEWWDLTSMSIIATVSGMATIAGTVTNVDIANDGTAYFLGTYIVGAGAQDAIYAVTPDGAISKSPNDGPTFSGPTRVFDIAVGDRRVLTATPGNGLYHGYLNYGEFVTIASQCSRDFALKADNSVWGVFQPSGSSNQVSLIRLDSGTTLTFSGLVTRSNPGSPTFCHVSEFAHFFVISDGKWYTIDDTTATIKNSGSWSGATNNLPRKAPYRKTFWSGYKEVSLEDASTVRTVDPNSWVGEDSAGGTVYDPTNNALWTHPQFAAHETIRLLDRGEMDANPAHVIYEALTNFDWGMGSPTSLIDVASFEEAGVELFNEPLGLSMIWTRQSTIQDFIQEVLDHIQAVLFVDPQTGLLTLKLIRGDYDVGTLPTISPSTANLTNFGRKLWGDIVNEISVTWTNPDNEQDETVTAHDLASITTQGGIVTASRNYYGVRYSDLAMRLASRDLRSAGAPLATCDAEVDRSLWFLRPASVLLVDWPEYGLDGVVMRITSIDYGKPGDPTIKLSMIEDVFGLDAGDYVAPPTSAWEDLSAAPTALDAQEALTLPYFFAANGLTTLTGATYPEVLAGALAASSNADVYAVELWGEVALSGGGTEWQALTTINLVGRAELSGALAAEALSTGVAFTNFVGTEQPLVGGFAIIGSSDEAHNEIALLTASDYSLSRGVLDTVPHSWTAGTPVWFVERDSLIEDPNPRSVGEVVDYRLLTRTSQGLLNLFSAPMLTATLSERPWLPLRPANVAISGVHFNDSSTPIDMIGASTVPLTWANRNRLSEDMVVLNWGDSTVAPETGQTTTVTVYKADASTVLATHGSLTGTSYSVPAADFGTEDIVYIAASASRTDADGTFDSLQAHGLYVRAHVSTSVEGLSGVATVSFTGGVGTGAAFHGAGTGSFSSGVSTFEEASLSASGTSDAPLVGASGETILFGLTGTPGGGLAYTGGTQSGEAFQVPANCTVTALVIVGNPSAASSTNWRLCMYGATDQTTWSGSLLGKTADQTGLGILEVKRCDLLVPVSLTAGEWVAVTTHTQSGMTVGARNATPTNRFFGDTYADGPAATAGASTSNSSSRGQVIYALGTIP